MDARYNEIIHKIVEILKRFLEPSRIILFGSRAKGKNSRHSDFDFALTCSRPPISIERKIKEEIEKVSGLYKVDVVYLDSVEEDFRKIILNTGKVVYERRT